MSTVSVGEEGDDGGEGEEGEEEDEARGGGFDAALEPYPETSGIFDGGERHIAFAGYAHNDWFATGLGVEGDDEGGLFAAEGAVHGGKAYFGIGGL